MGVNFLTKYFFEEVLMNVLVFVVAIVVAIVIGKALKTNIGVIALAMAFLAGICFFNMT